MRTIKKPDILFEDEHILVCFKPSGVPVQTRSASTPDMESILKNHLMRSAARAGASGAPSASRGSRRPPYLAVIHRLDQPVEGLLVFAKTPEAAAGLNSQLQSDSFGKYYKAIVCGRLPKASGRLTDYLVKDGRTNMSRICAKDTPGARYAELSYEILRAVAFPETAARTALSSARMSTDAQTPTPAQMSADAQTPTTPRTSSAECTLVRITLRTGRHHQIRVQMAAAGAPLLGDAKYNPVAVQNGTQLALCAYRLCFSHPVTGKQMEFELDDRQILGGRISDM